MKLHANDLLGQKYLIKKKIGAGSFGEIYLGRFHKNYLIINIKFTIKFYSKGYIEQ